MAGPRCYPGCYDYTNVLASVILAMLNAAIEKSLADPNLMVNFVKGSLESGGGSPEKLGTLAKADSVEIRAPSEGAQDQRDVKFGWGRQSPRWRLRWSM